MLVPSGGLGEGGKDKIWPAAQSTKVDLILNSMNNWIISFKLKIEKGLLARKKSILQKIYAQVQITIFLMWTSHSGKSSFDHHLWYIFFDINNVIYYRYFLIFNFSETSMRVITQSTAITYFHCPKQDLNLESRTLHCLNK